MSRTREQTARDTVAATARTKASQPSAGSAGKRRQGGGIFLWLLVLFVLLIAAVGGAIIGYFVITRFDMTIALRDLPATASIPQKLEGRAEVLDTLSLSLDTTIDTAVPVDQMVTIPVDDTLNLIAHFDGEVPLKLDVRLQDSIAFSQVVDLDTSVEAYLPDLGSTITIPLKGKIPIDTQVPVDLMIPLDENIRLNFSTPVRATIKQDLTVPLRTTIKASVPVDQALDVPLLNDIQARVVLPQRPMKARIVEADLEVPLRGLKLGWGSKDDEEGGEQ